MNSPQTARALSITVLCALALTACGEQEQPAGPSLEELQASEAASASPQEPGLASASASVSVTPAAPSSVPAPADAGAAVAAATETAKNYWATEDTIFNTPGSDSSVIGQVAVDPARTDTLEWAQANAELGNPGTYARKIEVQDSYVTDRTVVSEDGTEISIPNGFVGLTVCQDGTANTYENPERDEPDQKRSKVDVEIIYDTNSSTWKVKRLDFGNSTGQATSC